MMKTMLADYNPEAFVIDVEMFLRAVAYDRRYNPPRILAADCVRDLRHGPDSSRTA
jgi:hypothetical protein